VAKESPGKSTASPAKKKRDRRNPTRRRKCNKDELKFIQVYLETQSPTAACKAIGKGGKHPDVVGSQILMRPHIREKLDELRPIHEAKVTQKVTDQSSDAVLLNEQFLDKQLMQIAEKGGGHEYRGEADRVRAIDIGYKRLGTYDRMNPKQPQSAFAAAATQVNINGTPVAAQTGVPIAVRMYMPRWVREQLGIDSPASAAIDAKFGVGSDVGGTSDDNVAAVLGAEDKASS
jgi:hypothetical protein